MPNKPILLGSLLILLLMRFVGLPILDSQAEKRAELELITAQLVRVEQAVTDLPQLLEQLQKQVNANAEWQRNVPQARTLAELRLQIQQRVQQVLTSNGVQITLFNWLSEVEHDSEQLHVLRARLTIRSDAVPLFDASTDLFGDMPNLKIEEIEIQRQIQRRRGGEQYQSILLLTVIGQVGD